jgi:S1-C subfamily serine protease
VPASPPDLPSSPLARIVFWGLLVAALLLLAEPWLRGLYVAVTAEPRAVTPRGDLAADEQATIAIFENASPSVVYITTLKQVREMWTRNTLQVPSGTGSGFFWDGRGHVVTNYHVVQGAQAAQVRLADQRSFDAVLVGASPEHDLAVLRIDTGVTTPPALPIGVSRDLRVGQKVFAIGNPFGLDHTLTSGVISALDRSITDEQGQTIEHLIQTDAAINPGNSGGPLLDSAGRLIGINTAIYSPSGAYAGIGFAVPVDTVNRVVPRLIAQGRYLRPSLGVVTDDDLNRLAGEQLGVDGLLVLQVETGSAAERAGLRGARRGRGGALVPGDIVQAIDDTPLRRTADLLDALEKRAVGDRVTLTVWRDGDAIRVPVTLDR